ncbi:alpha/beta hydrolase [Clostridium perfringens]|uniref:alpha/beta hydrolase n=1 Tax=Clostridium perfringens TaxID=1502 RepID=UPI002AC72E67|nr:alpha/beta hydrolase [Clostridium perfringens]MDZ5130533.1 alpha/beta hydrolase fold domain-containing protein [Clostridium perfringens]
MWFKKLYVGTIDLLSGIVEKVAKCDLACKIYKTVFQLGVFPRPKNFCEIARNLIVEKDITYESSILEGNKLDVYYPKNLNKKAPILMWIHGGGYIANSKETVKNYMMTLANKGFVIFNIDYALAPKYKYPSQIVQCNEALKYVFENAENFNGDRENIFIGGDSAGAQMASQLAAIISNEELSKKMNLKPSITNKFLRGIILFCGLYNMDSLRATGFPGIKTYMEALTGESNFENYERIDELATIKYITSNYPSTFITVGDIDPFVDQGKELASSLRALGVKVVSRFFENKGLWHEYQFKFSAKEARETFKSVTEFLNYNIKSMN